MLFLTIVISGDSLAHSGKTDANGWHKDNQNKSGLGSYWGYKKYKNKTGNK